MIYTRIYSHNRVMAGMRRNIKTEESETYESLNELGSTTRQTCVGTQTTGGRPLVTTRKRNKGNYIQF